jgi:hypothetical protein
MQIRLLQYLMLMRREQASMPMHRPGLPTLVGVEALGDGQVKVKWEVTLSPSSEDSADLKADLEE